MAIPADLEKLNIQFWLNTSHAYDLTTRNGCGQYTEAWVLYAKGHGYPKCENLRKNPGQTQYRGHAIDAFLYTDGEGNPQGLYQAIDIIGGAEGENPKINWGVDIPRYTDSDIWHEPTSNNMVPWVAYDEQGFGLLKTQLDWDYSRRPQGPDYDVSVWAARVFHSQYMGPAAKPLGFVESMKKHRPEWCAALQVPVDNHWCVKECKIGNHVIVG